jgi:integrase
MSPAEVTLLIRAARSKRDRILIEVACADGLRVSEIVNLTWADVLPPSRQLERTQAQFWGVSSRRRRLNTD